MRQVFELVALSCKELFLVVHRDKVVLRARTSFLTKLVSAFRQDIVYPFAWPQLNHRKFLYIV